jgi:AcrR family transcriptional regulator
MTKKQTPKTDPNARERLLEAAVDVFGKHGFEAATTRMIAKSAGVNIAAIPYYFSGKEGLYQAAVSHIVEKIEAKAETTLQEIAALASEKHLPRETALGAVEILIGGIVNFMVGDQEAPRVARIILREQLDPSSAYDIIYTRIMSRIINAIAGFLTVILEDISPRTARLRAMAMMGQVMAFRVARETMVRMVGLEGYSATETEEVHRIVLEHTRGSIESLSRGDEKAEGGKSGRAEGGE